MRGYLSPRRSVTPATIRAEGICELGRIGSVLYVVTDAKVRLFHALSIERLKTPDTRVTPLQVVGMDVA